ncbi:hypothetical protein F4778DRAFT_761696 [Xylariomycetidae sp. FL2044]|nr:hypothetical protein F4778DRAFT_761696 [Xylariomycetidae sp. FL2044]
MDDTNPPSTDKQSSHRGHGITEILEVIEILKGADVTSCITGGKALRYYGVARIPKDWHVCVPDASFPDATAAFTSLGDKYEPAPGICPQLKSARNTYPRFKLKGVAFTFFVIPASEHFLGGLDATMIEHSSNNNNIPYPKLDVIAQSLVLNQHWPELAQLIDGMDLSEEWGYSNLHLDQFTPAELDYIANKNQKVKAAWEAVSGVDARGGTISTKVDRKKKWRTLVEGKESRIGPHLPHDRYLSQFRRKGSEDPRLKEGRDV